MTIEQIKDLITRCYDAAVERGDYKCPECLGNGYIIHEYDRPGGIPGRRNVTCKVCGGSKIDPNKNIGALLCDVVEELMDAKRAFREGRVADWERYDKLSREYEVGIKNTPGDKLASAFIRLLSTCGYIGLTPQVFPDLEMECFENIGQELSWISWPLLNQPGFIEYYEQTDDLSKELRDLGLVIKRMETFCIKHNIPIEKHIEAKLAYRRQRES